MRTRLAASFIVVALASFLLGWSFGPRLTPAPAAPAPATERQERAVSVMLDFGDGTVRTYEGVAIAEGETLFDVMRRLSERGDGFVFRYQPPGAYGILIDQIGDKVGGTDGKYWLWYENNRMGQVASDAYVLAPGDVIEWKFINLKM